MILDEADMMLNVGFEEDVETILQSVPEQRQTMLFSATMPSWIKKLTQRYLKKPALVDLVGDEEAGKMAEHIKYVSSTPLPAFYMSGTLLPTLGLGICG